MTIKEAYLFGEMMYGLPLEDLNYCVALQFTGLQDKNGRDIYEGDIIKFISKEDILYYYGYPFKVEYKNYGFICFERIDEFNCEIIGNSYENPELLK